MWVNAMKHKKVLIAVCVILSIVVWSFVIIEFVLPVFGVQYENHTYAGISRQEAEDKALDAAGEGAHIYGEYEGDTPDGAPAWEIKVEKPAYKVTVYYVSGDFCYPEQADDSAVN